MTVFAAAHLPPRSVIEIPTTTVRAQILTVDPVSGCPGRSVVYWHLDFAERLRASLNDPESQMYRWNERSYRERGVLYADGGGLICDADLLICAFDPAPDPDRYRMAF